MKINIYSGINRILIGRGNEDKRVGLSHVYICK